ncbi:MAG: spiro-SPASM protein [Treponemataceae bacterium]
MEAITILNALEINEFAFENLNNNISSVEQAIKRGKSFPEVGEVAIISDKKKNFIFPDGVKVLSIDKFSSKDFFKAMAELGENYKTVFFASCDAPFLDANITEELFQTHKKYKAEYTFADGYPKGLAPEVLDMGLVKILASISNLENIKGNREFVFDVLKQNINSYDIEVIIADEDTSDLRLEFFSNSKRNFLLCQNFLNINTKNYYELIKTNSKKFFTLPAFYAIEISAERSVNKIYHPEKKISDTEKILSLDNFKKIIDKIVAYSDDAFVSFSIFGEPFLNAEIYNMLEYCFEQKKISVLIETSALDFDEQQILKIKKLVDEKNAHAKIFWIVTLDAFTGKKYSELSGLSLELGEKFFNKALENTFLLHQNFSRNVFPQFIRMNENEDELEEFYRFWNEKINKVLIQKYDNLAGQIADRRVVDLSPVNRNVCWHLKRDMYILQNGNVLVCKADAFEKNIVGNIFTDEIKNIREKIFETYLQHLEKNYKGLCDNCDEYYTYNF